MSINKITNLKEAKKYYLEMSCSHFHMAREYPERYSEYKKQLITKDQEELWVLEFISLKRDILNTVYTSEELRSIFRDVNTAVKSTYNDTVWEKYLDILETIIKQGDSFCKLIVIESIIQDMGKVKAQTISYAKQFYHIIEHAIDELDKNPFTYDESTKNDSFIIILNTLEEKKIMERISKLKEVFSKHKSNII